MTYRMFLDDERFPITDDWLIVRSSEEAKCAVAMLGMPSEIAFDHDLGGEDTSIPFIWFIIDSYLDGNLQISQDFNFSVHSQNSVGAENIRQLMSSFLKTEVFHE